MRKHLLGVLTAMAAVAAIASPAGAESCQGLACAGVLPASSAAHDPLLPTVAVADDLTDVQKSGFYAYNTRRVGGERAVAYVVARGEWANAPAEIKALPLADDLMQVERTSKHMVIYGPGAMESGPWAPTVSATSARKVRRNGVTAVAAAASDCVSPWFCVFTDSSYGGNKCQWQSTGVWQTMPSSCNLQASSMVNRRSAWSLLKRTDGRNYCAVPGSQDSSLSNNGFNDNTYETYNSTATTQQSGWNCAN